MTHHYQNQCDDVCYSPCNYGTVYGYRSYECGSPCGFRGYGGLCGYRGLYGLGDCYGYSSRYCHPYSSRYCYPYSSRYTRRYSVGSCYPC
ncbi:keratin-associated protein 20-1-like [Rhea pennata]|uniref:keratin-associated protein 20-1-like n=1 Tax=Rhea pennata TaxID=8795 RepID=UPI002E2757DD